MSEGVADFINQLVPLTSRPNQWFLLQITNEQGILLDYAQRHNPRPKASQCFSIPDALRSELLQLHLILPYKHYQNEDLYLINKLAINRFIIRA